RWATTPSTPPSPCSPGRPSQTPPPPAKPRRRSPTCPHPNPLTCRPWPTTSAPRNHRPSETSREPPTSPIGCRMPPQQGSYRSAFWAWGILADLGVVVSLLLLGRQRRAAVEQPEPTPVAHGN